jgi:hypothetical protein
VTIATLSFNSKSIGFLPLVFDCLRMLKLFQHEGISPEGTFPSRGIETFGAPPLMLP